MPVSNSTGSSKNRGPRRGPAGPRLHLRRRYSSRQRQGAIPAVTLKSRNLLRSQLVWSRSAVFQRIRRWSVRTISPVRMLPVRLLPIRKGGPLQTVESSMVRSNVAAIITLAAWFRRRGRD